MRVALLAGALVLATGCGLVLDLDPSDPPDLGAPGMDGGGERDLGADDLGARRDGGHRVDAGFDGGVVGVDGGMSIEAGTGEAGASDGGLRSCRSRSDCHSGEFCPLPDGDCGGDGVCAPLPGACTAVFDPVCGCDGADYGNACLAHAAGTNVAFVGPCTDGGGIRFCMSNGDCDPSEFCEFVVGSCGTTGVCGVRPIGCTGPPATVCGCDGVTYGSACLANEAGTSVNFGGTCLMPTCSPGCCCTSMDCGGGSECVMTGGSLDGVCHAMFAPSTGLCWTDADCAASGGTCHGALVCPCVTSGPVCTTPETPGTCG